MSLYKEILEFFDIGVYYIILLIELVGIGVLIYTVVKALLGLFRGRDRIRLDLAEGIALTLEFKLGSELLRTVIVRDWEELLILGAIVLLRAAMTFLIQWEIRIEKKHELEKEQKAIQAKQEQE
jgi:uncharacterized membrane protein